MTDFPSKATIQTDPKTSATHKTDLGNWIDATRELLGASAEESLTISSGQVTPTVAICGIRTEASATTDDLTNILTTNHPDGRLILIYASTPSEDVVVKHAAGGAGEINLVDLSDFTMDDFRKYLLLQRRGTEWSEVFRSYGNDGAAARLFFGVTLWGQATNPGGAGDRLQTLQVDEAGTDVELVGPISGYRNRVVNGDVSIWQNGGGPFTAVGYCADQFYIESEGTNGVASVSRIEPSPGFHEDARYKLEWDQTTGADAGSNPSLLAIIEDVRTLQGQEAVLSCWAEDMDGSGFNVTVELLRDFGSGGSAREALAATLGTLAVPDAYGRTQITFTMPGSLGGKTIGAGNFIAVRFKFAPVSTFRLQMTNLQLERGPKATVFEATPKADQERRCSRYFVKSQSEGVLPGTTETHPTHPGALVMFTDGGGQLYRDLRFPVEMFLDPTVTVYNPETGTTGQAARVEGNGTGNAAITVENKNRKAAMLKATSVGGNLIYRAHYAADARVTI